MRCSTGQPAKSASCTGSGWAKNCGRASPRTSRSARRVPLQPRLRAGSVPRPKMLREVGDRTPQPKLPAGWTVCEVDGEQNWGERVETHREVCTLRGSRSQRSVGCGRRPSTTHGSSVGGGGGRPSSRRRVSELGGSSREGSRMEGLQTIGSALLTLGRVAMAVALSLDERLGLERDRRRRSPLVRTACRDRLRYSLIFGLESIGAVALLLVGMVLFAAWTSARRAGTCRGLL
jgi:hypothetical protein